VQVHLGVSVDQLDFGSMLELARTAERSLFDVVVADDLTALAALAGVTERLGLVGRVDPAVHEPFEVARQLATLDHLSEGRAGYTVVASSRTAEFVTVVGALWDSWQADAVLADLDTGIYVDPSRIHPVDHTGAAFDVRGMATLPAGPQGHPVLVPALSPLTFDGTADQIAERIDHHVRAGDCDGFLLTPDGLDDFVASVVPLLQKRGVFRTAYRGRTLRENLGRRG
jgi:alkanesulfonate monooxygenase SsuD/methylene tetrahydromethanopterin reductase-like flavin-dependent oxidoreductase (luciferase family)